MAARAHGAISGRSTACASPSIIDPRRVLTDDQDVPIDFSISPTSFTFVSYVDVLEGRVPRAMLAGKTVFVGATAVELGDMLSVPLYGSLPGIVVQALAAETVNQGAPRALPMWASLALIALWAALAALMYGARWPRNLAALAFSLTAIFALSLFAYSTARLLLDIAAPMLVVTLLFVAAIVRSLEAQTWRAISYALGMRRRDALLKSVVQSSTDCILCIDEAGIIKTANPAASKLFGCATYELLDEPVAKFITLLAGEAAGARLGALHGVIRECDARTLDGEVFPVEISVSRVRLNTERLYTAIVRDIRERRVQQNRLQHQATHDSLTSLPNRAALLTRLEARSAPVRRGHAGAAHARPVPLQGGQRHAGPQRRRPRVVRRRATVPAALGDRGLIARIGGDEFTVVLDQPESIEAISSISQMLADCLRAPIDVAGISIEIGVSIGIARFPQDASDAQTLLRHADVAMYVAKRRGAAYEYYDAAHDENTVRKLAIGGELRAAIASNQLEMHFQPQVNLRSGMVESAEALLRWFHPTQGAIGPTEFIAIAEATDLIRPLTEWTLRGRSRRFARWRERGVHLRIAVNLSARLLQDTAFPARLGSCWRTRECRHPRSNWRSPKAR